MKMKHLALGTTDVLRSQRFYCDYFGFRAEREDGFLINGDDFVLVLERVDEVPASQSWLHYGFHCEGHDEVRALFARMKADSVPIAQELDEQRGMLVFFCVDPAGYLVEVRAVGRAVA
jgi:catechol 2,3-dioxygenase-like lactoylglutathione lyase family enzyme